VRCTVSPHIWIIEESMDMRSKLTVAVAVLAVTAAACGSDDGGAESPESESAAATTTAVPETTTTTTTTTIPETTTTTTTLPETTTTPEAGIPTEPVVPGADEDVDAIVEVYTVVFDSTTSYEEKAPYVTDFAGLEDTVVAYEAAGEAVGGIALSADEVGIEGDEARVLYSFLFAGNPAYSDLEGSAVRTDAGWQITREFFCDIMTSARVGCP
jgi:hypothetical protein